MTSKLLLIVLYLNSEAGNDSATKIIYDDQPDLLTAQLLKDLLSILKPEGQLEIVQFVDTTEFNLKTAGFVNVVKTEGCMVAFKPKYAVGSSVKLNLKKATVWKLEDDDEDDLIDPDDLLDEDDLKKPDPTSLKGRKILLICSLLSQYVFLFYFKNMLRKHL